MHGVIAAGSEPTAQAGAEILRLGGNAADAAVAACFATSAGEPTLTSLAGAGVLMHRDGASGVVTVCDFFSDAPRLGPKDVEGFDFFHVDLDFGPTTQRFYIGAGAASVPGVIPGLCQVLERFGTLPLAEIIAPACRMLRDGVVLGPYQGRAAKLLEPILTHTESGRKVFAPEGRILVAGDRFFLPQLADTLEALAREGWRKHYDGSITSAMLSQFGPAAGGLLTADDFAAYEVRFAQPLELRYRHSHVVTMPPPAAGGAMIALMLRLLETVDLASLTPLSPDYVRVLAAAMTTADEARGEGIQALQRFERWRAHFETLCKSASLPPPPPAMTGREHTTHVSVIDAAGNAAAVTFSYGEGNAHIVGDTGIMMNNLMGEEDLHPAGFGNSPRGTRLSTMMSPTLLIDDDGVIVVMGTGGANRIRTAIVQVIGLLEDAGFDAAAAVAAPRMHFEDGVLNVEVFDLPDGGDALAALGPSTYVRFPERSLFFGGVHLVRRAADGKLDGGGDPRRGGVCIIV
ncbi:MAG TPA: gamma-glutamyltransferase [Polyangiaceae bacterium]|nr:gamma-glutamyltransferase [Polyangiaceae bacterium]